VLVFTVDLPLAGPRHRDARHGIGLGGLAPRLVRALELLARPRWLVDVGLLGRPHAFGSLVDLVPDARDPEAIRAFIDAQFDPGVTWRDIDWLRARWPGRLVLKGVLDPDDARRAVDTGADAIVVSNHGGRQLDGAPSTARALPAIVEAVGDRTEVLVDGGIRSGLDLFRALALGARGALIGRAWAYAIAGGGARGLARVLAGIRRELELAMALAGVTRIAEIGRSALARLDDPPFR
jgi:L-lactate dehydrogenase (cytochrome)